MLAAVAEGLKSFLSPGSPWPLLVSATAAVALAFATPRSRRFFLGCAAALCAAYWVASLPAVANQLATCFHRLPGRIVNANELDGVQAIVVLGAGASTFEENGRALTIPSRQSSLNVLEAERLYRLLQGRPPVIASGGIVSPRDLREPEAQVLAHLLIELGVAPSRILLEPGSRTTHEQVLLVGDILRAHGWRRIAVVTAPVHLLRATGGFALLGFDVLAAPARFASETHDATRPSWAPDRQALELSLTSVYDYAALAYYRWRGWTRLSWPILSTFLAASYRQRLS
jgi:uncharacterized SAM-binding protein YcdF (DUF218 family)